MRTFILTLVTVAMIESTYANVVCETVKHRAYPSSDNAKVIAGQLGVKTCDGERFKSVVESLDMSIEYSAASDETLEALEAAESEKRDAELERIRRALN